MSDFRPITEFDIHFDEGAPRHNVGEVVEARAIELLRQHGIDPSEQVVLLPMHSLKECPANGGPIAAYRFDVCICPVIRILIAVVSKPVIEMLQDVPGAVDKLSPPIEEGEGN